MFSREVLAGILLSKGQFFCNVQVDEKMRLGYSVKLGLDIRMDSYGFLSGIKRAFQTYGIESRIKNKESTSRARPILKVRGINNLEKIAELLRPYTLTYLNHDATLEQFIEILSIVLQKKHRTMEGLDNILKLKGVLNGTNESK